MLAPCLSLCLLAGCQMNDAISRSRASALPLSTQASLILLAAMCCIPFLLPHHMNPIPSFANEWMAAALGLLACLPLLMRRSWQPLHFPIITLVPIELLAVVGLQVATGLANYWQQHMLVALYLGWATMMMMLGSALRQQAGIERLVPVIAWTLLAAGSISVGIVALQVAGVEVVWIVPHLPVVVSCILRLARCPRCDRQPV